MTNAAQITELPLITVKTVKRKHLKHMAEYAQREWPQTEEQPEIIGYIEEWSCLLCRFKSRIEMYRVWTYQEFLWSQAKGSGADRQAQIDAANASILSLPQLFLD